MGRLRIGIAGAGTAGLAAAAFLARDGHDVSLFERFETPKPIGAGLLLQPTGLAALARLGLDQAAIDLGQPVSQITGDTVAGVRILDLSYRDLGANVFGLGLHRGSLFQLLYAEVIRLGVALTPGSDLTGSRRTAAGRTLIDRQGGEFGPFDLVIDATGVRSPLRRAEAEVRYQRPYPWGALWGVVAEPPDWPHTHRLLQRYDGCHTMVGMLPVGSAPGDRRRLIALFWSLKVEDEPRWRAQGLGRWKARVAAVAPEALALLAQIDTPAAMTFATYADIALRRHHGPRIVFIGDAGRALSPQLGQGANLALIDAATLAHCLAAAGSLEAALTDFSRRRRRHDQFYALASRWLTPFFQSDSLSARLVRDLAFPHLKRVPGLNRQMALTLAGMKTGLFTHLKTEARPRDITGARSASTAGAGLNNT